MKSLGSFTIAAVALIVCARSATGAEAADGIWGKVIVQGPLDTRPFRAIRPPGWVMDLTTNVYCVSITEEFDLAAQLGAQIGELRLVDLVHVNYDSAYLKSRNPDLPADYAEKMIAEYKKRGIRIISGHGPWLQAEIYKAHPEWRAIDANTTEIPEVDMDAQPYGGRLCQLGPWGEYLLDILAEILTKYPDVDGFNFDGIHHFGPCYCGHCRAAYRSDTGQEIPDADMADLAFRPSSASPRDRSRSSTDGLPSGPASSPRLCGLSPASVPA